MHHTLFCDVGWDNGDLLRPCSGSPWRTTMPGHPQVMQRRNDTQRSNLFFCREIHHISKFQIESNRFISYHIIFMYVFGWMEGWCSSLLHPQSKLVKTTKGESSAQSESCEDQWFQCMDIYIYYTYMYIYQGWSSMIHIFISVRMERSICCPLLCKTWPCQFLQVMEDWTWNTLNGNQCWQSMGIWLVLWLLCSFPVIATYSGMLWIVLLHPK